MQLGMIGLGRMGGNIVRRLMKQRPYRRGLRQGCEGRRGARRRRRHRRRSRWKISWRKLEKPRTVWVMLPAGKITEATIEALAELMQPGDVIIDGGNTFWQDDIRRGEALKAKGMHYLDVGTSGGVWGLERGYCMMIGGDKAVVDRLDPIFDAGARASATSRARRGARAAIRASSRATSTPARPAPAISSR